MKKPLKYTITLGIIAIVSYIALPSLAQEATDTKVTYFLQDHLGSTDVLVDADGNVVERSDHLPFGADRVRDTAANPVESDYRFTGVERDDQTGMDYFGARYYDSAIGRFTQIDPVLVGKGRFFNMVSWLSYPQKLNAYNYTTNRPITMIDLYGEGAGRTRGEGFGQALLSGTITAAAILSIPATGGASAVVSFYVAAAGATSTGIGMIRMATAEPMEGLAPAEEVIETIASKGLPGSVSTTESVIKMTTGHDIDAINSSEQGFGALGDIVDQLNAESSLEEAKRRTAEIEAIINSSNELELTTNDIVVNDPGASNNIVEQEIQRRKKEGYYDADTETVLESQCDSCRDDYDNNGFGRTPGNDGYGETVNDGWDSPHQISTDGF